MKQQLIEALADVLGVDLHDLQGLSQDEMLEALENKQALAVATI